MLETLWAIELEDNYIRGGAVVFDVALLGKGAFGRVAYFPSRSLAKEFLRAFKVVNDVKGRVVKTEWM